MDAVDGVSPAAILNGECAGAILSRLALAAGIGVAPAVVGLAVTEWLDAWAPKIGCPCRDLEVEGLPFIKALDLPVLCCWLGGVAANAWLGGIIKT